MKSKYARVVAGRKIKKMYNSESTSTSIAEAETHAYIYMHTRTHRYIACIFKNEISLLLT